jgi:hypothetical protein
MSMPFGLLTPTINFKVRDAVANTGAGKTGLSGSSSGLIISTITDVEATAVTYTQSGSLIDSITTIGTYVIPTATHCRLKAVDATNNPGLYQLMLDPGRFSVANSKELNITVSGVTNYAQTDIKIRLLPNTVAIKGSTFIGNVTITW